MKKNNSKQHLKIINKKIKGKTVNLSNKTKNYFIMDDLFIKQVTRLPALIIPYGTKVSMTLFLVSNWEILKCTDKYETAQLKS